MAKWLFDDPPNVAVFTTKFVLDGTDWINYVSHDIDDGSWQFHGDSSPAEEENARIVGLSEIVRVDPTIIELNTLPLGWYAWRKAKDSPWNILKDSRWSESIRSHYEDHWNIHPEVRHWSLEPIHELPIDFCILEFAPSSKSKVWIYATCGMAQPYDSYTIELFLLSPVQDVSLVELLTVIAHYHRNDSSLGLHHTVNFGRPWLPESKCDHGFISMPYLDGDALGCLNISEDTQIQFLWLIPITKEEVEFKKTQGVEALEEKFEESEFDYINPLRESII